MTCPDQTDQTDQAPPGTAAFSAPAAVPSPWGRLRTLTAARIGLERSGASIATGPSLDFRLAHARARDAVHDTLDDVRLSHGARAHIQQVLVVHSAAQDRKIFLLRPDLGRCLGPEARAVLAPHAGEYDLAVVVADGLSARAVQTHAVPTLAATLPALRAEDWRIAPLVLVHQGRVAVGDAVAAQLGASAVMMLIGERPGLSSADSMGAYLTWQPDRPITDAERNCVSNIRPEGVGYVDAAFKLVFLLRQMRSRRISGVHLKDESEERMLTTLRVRQL